MMRHRFPFQPSMPVATLPQAVQIATQGTHRMSEGDRKVHPAGLDQPESQQPGLSERRRRRSCWEQRQSHAFARRIRG